MNPATILVVEDEALIAADLQGALEHLGYRVPRTVGTARDALDAAREILPDLVLMDVNLRGEADGITAARWIRDERPVPVVFLTAHGDPTTLARAGKVEPSGYLIKPFDDRTLHATVQVALARAEAEKARDQRRRLLQQAVDLVERVVLGLDGEGRVRLSNQTAQHAGVEVDMTLAQALDAVGARDGTFATLRSLRDRRPGLVELADGPTIELLPTEDGAAIVFVSSPETGQAPLRLCAWCQQAKDEETWKPLEHVLHERYHIHLSHGICESCVHDHFGDVLDDRPEGEV